MSARPPYDRIVVKRIGEGESACSGVVISAREELQEGEVLAVCRGKRLEDARLVAPNIRVGDRVLFGRYSGSETRLKGVEYIIMREEDILCVLDPEQAN